MMKNKYIDLLLKKTLTEFCLGHLAEAANLIQEVINHKVKQRMQQKIQKVLLLLLLGQFYSLDTLNQLLKNYDIESNDFQKLWQKLSCDFIVGLMNQWLWDLFSPEFIKRIGQSGPSHSRYRLTLVIDASIFKQWLEQEEFGKYFAKYYSGQYNCAVYGFNVLLCGMSIGDMFYPLHFQLRRKDEKDTEVAQRMLSKVHKKLAALASTSSKGLPQLYLSVDSGFRSNELIDSCKKNGIIYIGVPKSSHVVYLKNKKLKIKDLKEEFKKKEADYIAQQKKKKQKIEPFEWRVRVQYNCMDCEVVLLLFRLNGSKNVSVIFCNELTIKAKTLRRHWFERTKIELLFRLIKQNLKIQRTTVRNRLGFMKKLAFALVKSVYAQFFTQMVQKTCPKLRRFGIRRIKQRLLFHQIGKEWLDHLVQVPTFCKNHKNERFFIKD